MSNTESIPAGLYHIVVADLGHVGNERLSRQGNNVTLLPPGAVPASDQVWRVLKGRDSEGTIIIERPAHMFPSTYLTYDAAPYKPKQGNHIQVRISEFPLNEWRADMGSEFRVPLQVAGSDLCISAIRYSHEAPLLKLSKEEKLFWAFTPVDPY